MKKEVSPALAAVVIVALLGVVALGWYRFGGVTKEKNPPPTMPPEVAAQWSKYTNGAAAGRGAASSVPGSQTGMVPKGSGMIGGPPGGMPMGSPPGGIPAGSPMPTMPMGSSPSMPTGPAGIPTGPGGR